MEIRPWFDGKPAVGDGGALILVVVVNFVFVRPQQHLLHMLRWLWYPTANLPPPKRFADAPIDCYIFRVIGR
jgi:hypothetical protein